MQHVSHNEATYQKEIFLKKKTVYVKKKKKIHSYITNEIFISE